MIDQQLAANQALNYKKADFNDLKNKEIENLKLILEDHHIKFSLEKEVLVKNLVLKAAEVIFFYNKISTMKPKINYKDLN